MTWRRWLSFGCFALGAALAPQQVRAQVAPTGSHFGGRPSDTGFMGGVSSSGGYSTSVPLDLPPARGGLPVPVHIVYGERGFGAAGLGWDVPLSYIQRDTTFTRRRPVGTPSVAPQPREQLSVTLAGSRVDLIRTATAWIGRLDATDLEVRQQTDGSWVMYDGKGLTYTFGLVSSSLTDTNIWLLTDIAGAAGSKVHLAYTIGTPSLPAGTGVSIDLKSASYNPSPVAGETCYKHDINLNYESDATAPLSTSVLGTSILARLHKLSSIDVVARSTCSSSTEVQRKYQLGYLSDRDTRQLRLVSVTMTGRAGTPEASTALPVATYTYGSASNGSELTFRKASSPALGFSALGTTTFLPSNGFNTTLLLLDMTGDGRPDRATTGSDGNLSIQNNTSAVDHISFNAGSSIGPGIPPELVSPDGAGRDMTWDQVIDFNGDGRMDIVSAGEVQGSWVVYLNTPDPTAGHQWQRLVFSITDLAQQLRNRGFTVGNWLPLSQRYTSTEFVRGPFLCYRWLQAIRIWQRDAKDDVTCDADVIPEPLRRTTFIEWELKDINGDGYPDFVFNSGAVGSGSRKTKFPTNPEDGEQALQANIITAALPKSTVEAVLNVLGNRAVVPGVQLFSAPITLTSDGCGVARWIASDTTLFQFRSQDCGLEDVNGDGLPDRVVDKSVFLGRGTVSSAGWFTQGAMITLPGPLSIHEIAPNPSCDIPGADTYIEEETVALRDITGDGIPDYVSKPLSGGPVVRLGTGTGFGRALAIGGAFELSRQTERCDGTNSTNYSGLFDVDGDGKPDVIYNAEVWSLVGPSGETGAPDAGRLTRIDNGYGAQTSIHYRSIKADPGTHQVPFPEVVVDTISTTGTRGQGGDLSAMNYAYDGAELTFDPAADAFRFLGYRRRLELATPVSQPAGVGSLIITDYYTQYLPIDPYNLHNNVLDRDPRYAIRTRFGRISDVTVLSGNLGATALANPSQLLSINVTNDPRRIGHAHYDWGAKLLSDPSDPAGSEACLEQVYPYSSSASISYAQDATNHAYDPCIAHGFAYVASADSWRSDPGAAPPLAANVETRTDVVTIDNFGRPLRMKYFNDVHRTDDDICVDTTYAEPTGANERVRFAPASQAVSACDTTTIFAKETWEYDGQTAGHVAAGLVTSHSVERRDDTGARLATIRQFDATYDVAGNPKTVTTTRAEDGASRSVTVDYDPFGLAPVTTTVTPSIGPSLQTLITRDPVTLNATAVTEPNGTQYGTAFDGFQRVTQSTVTPVGGAAGVLSKYSYFGFPSSAPVGECMPGKTLRCVTTKVFTDPVAPTQVDTAEGRTSTTFFDELGRQFRSEVKLGARYDNKKLVVASRTYDGLGRVLLEREPFAIADGDADPATYATTYYFNADGTPSCFVRGTEKQPYTEASDEIHQIFPTCFRRSFESNTEVVSVKDAASLLSHSPQDGVEHRSYVTAIGRTLRRSTYQGATRLEHAEFSYDPLGHRTGMTRYKDANAGGLPVTSSWHFDSLGQMTELDEPDSVPQLNTYSDWGELLKTYRRVTSAGGTTITRSVVKQYDALSRLTHSEEQTDDVADPDTLYDYLYDQGVNIAPQVTPTNMRGRLAQASSPTGAVSFSYDALGATNARVFTDPDGKMYVEQRSWHADGSLSALDLFLPDTAYAREHVDYTYDSAGRSRSVKYAAADNQDLFDASTIDPLGRVREAKFGQATYSAAYDDVGRRLLTQVAVSSPLGSRTLNFPDYDPVGRERSRNEVKAGVTKTTTSTYDALGRLSSSLQTAGTATLFDQHFTYDPLGNMLSRTEAAAGPGPTSTTLSYLDGVHDRDRICRIAFGSDTRTDCNVTYDEVGSITSQPTPTGSRQYTYYLDGSVRTVTDDHGSTAHYRYDALGGVQTLDLTSSISPDQRNDVHHGDLLVVRNARTANEFISRTIPGPDGSVASRRGAGGPWVFEFGEARGNRFFVDDHGAFVQDVDYDSYGASKSSGAQPGNKLYSNEQWNGGDALAAFGISQLGARLYDPAIGRFLSRDPFLIMRTASTTNPYAFAANDPVNYVDPTGLQFYSDCTNCAASSVNGTPVTMCIVEDGADPFTKLRDSEKRRADADNNKQTSRFDTLGYGFLDYFNDLPIDVQRRIALAACLELESIYERRINPTLIEGIQDDLDTISIVLSVIPMVGAETRAIGRELGASIGSVFAKEVELRSANEALRAVKVVEGLRVLEAEEGAGIRGAGTKTDRLKEHILNGELDAARREAKGEVVARKSNGVPFDHGTELRQAQAGLLNQIKHIKSRLGHPNLDPVVRDLLQDELAEASWLLDLTEAFLPR